jgi:hypothetical protein
MGPVSGTGRAMMASLNSAVKKGMPVDQAIAYVKSMAKDGVAPLVDLYAMLNQYQRLQQQQVKPPQTPPTIRDQMNMMEQQQAQQAQMQQGLGGLGTGVMENAQFAGGGIVAFQEGGQAESEIERLRRQRAEAYRSGDLRAIEQANLAIKEYQDRKRAEKIQGGVASIAGIFDVGRRSLGMGRYSPYRRDAEGVTALSESTVPETTVAAPAATAPISQPSPYDYFAPQGASIYDAAPQIQPDENMRQEALRRNREEALTIPDFTASERAAIQKQIKELEGTTPKSRADRYREAGIEDVIPGQIERLREQMSGLDEERKRDRYLALAEAGFAGAAAASKPGATLLGSLGVGGKEGARRLSEVNKEYRTLRSNLMGKVDEMERYRQGRLEGQIDRDIEREDNYVKSINQLQRDLARLVTEREKLQIQAGLTREGREPDAVERLKRRYVQALEEGREDEAQRIYEQLEKLGELSTGVLAARAQQEGKPRSILEQMGGVGLGGVGGFSRSAIDEELARRGQ